MKKTILFFVMMFLCPKVSLAEYPSPDFFKDDFGYCILGSGLVITVCVGSGDIVIPEIVEYQGKEYYVKGIFNEAFWQHSQLTSISFPNSVTYIPDYCLWNCSGLTSVKIGNYVTTIGEQAFAGCSSLTSITIGTELKSIGHNAFGGCDNLNNVKVSITDYASFCENKALGCISSSLGKPVQLINEDGTEIKEYVVPEGVTSIGSCAFNNCSGLTSITIPNSVTNIGGGAFVGCI